MLARLETMVLMGMELPLPAIRSQIASALDVMVHVARMRDRSRKVTAIEEVVGIENGEIVLRPLFSLDGGGRAQKGRRPQMPGKAQKGRVWIMRYTG